jgi:diguanylate cyclase (GGDEF)-like protein
MRVRDRIVSAVPAGVAPHGAPESADQPAAVQPVAPARATRQTVDIATIMGVPEPELTPKVRAAIDRLMAEVQSLREELGRARRRVEYLEQLADRDPLAPVLNRRAFVRELTRMIAFAERYGVSGSVLYFDIDGMKRINDTWGHAAGDAALKHVAEALLRDVRASDFVGRLGGDEFGIILAQADARAAAAKARALAEAIAAAPVPWHDEALEIRVSYGIYTFAGGEGVDEALNAADHAMYASKRDANDATG